MSFLFEKIKKEMSGNEDLICRELVSKSGKVEIYFLKSMTDKELISKQIIEPILSFKETFDFYTLKNGIVRASEVEEINKDEIVDKILKDFVVLNFNDNFLAFDIEKVPTRTPSEPPTSPNIYGPREGFVESLQSNLSLIRKRLQTKDLVISNYVIGKQTNTKVSLLY